MYIFRVAISFMRERMHHMHERACLAMGPAQALSDTLATLNIYPHAVSDFKSYVCQPDSLGEFSRDATILPVVGSDMKLEDLWRTRKGD